MAEILPFKRPKLSEKHKGKTLCRNGHHKWELERDSVFDTKKGRLVSSYRCVRCGKVRTKAT
jgi:hypothetical protein